MDDQSTEMKAGCAASYAQLLGDITEADSRFCVVGWHKLSDLVAENYMGLNMAQEV